MSYQINLHAPVGVEDFTKLSPKDFVSITKHEGKVTITDVYYQPSFAKNESKKDSFLKNLSNLFERMKGYKSANDSDSLFQGIKNIGSQNKNSNPNSGMAPANSLPGLMHELARTNGHEKFDGKGTTITLLNWTPEEKQQYENKFGPLTTKKPEVPIQEIEKDLQDLSEILKNLDGA